MAITKTPGFLESEIGKSEPEKCLFHVIPAGYEKSVSYGTGTARGPEAILAASQQLEVLDRTGIPSDKGIYTHTPVLCTGPPEDVLKRIEISVADVISREKIPVLLGGEHTVSVGAFSALNKMASPVGIVQFDAHADLRDTYEGTPLSHACVMHRAVDMGFPIFQIGVRSFSPYEAELRTKKSIPYLDAEEIARRGIPEQVLPNDFPDLIYISFDVDGLDPSVISSTGTPEPGGILWYQALDILENVISGRKVIGFDIVELAPDGSHASDYAAARLTYSIMGLIDRNGKEI